MSYYVGMSITTFNKPLLINYCAHTHKVKVAASQKMFWAGLYDPEHPLRMPRGPTLDRLSIAFKGLTHSWNYQLEILHGALEYYGRFWSEK